MKILKSFQFIVILAVSYLMAFSSCKKNSDSTPPPSGGTLGMHLHTNVDTSEVNNYGDTFLIKKCDTCSANTRRIVVTKAQMYISGIQLVKSDGSTAAATGTVLQMQDMEAYTVGAVASGNYVSIKFNAAIDDFEGSIDTSASGSSGNLVPFKFKFGTSGRTVSMGNHQTQFNSVIGISPNSIGYVHMMVDYAKLFTGIQLKDSARINITNPSDANAAAIADNIHLMFEYEE